MSKTKQVMFHYLSIKEMSVHVVIAKGPLNCLSWDSDGKCAK